MTERWNCLNRRDGLRGQVATEFLLYTAVFMFLVIAAFIVVNQIQSSEIPLRQNNVAKETGENFATILTLAVKGGEGFSYNYTFPKTLFGAPYEISLMPQDQDVIIIDWAGQYGNFSYSYYVPAYNYTIGGACLSGKKLVSDRCSNVLNLYNDGKNLTITQGA